MTENLLLGIFVGIVVFITYLSYSSKRREIEENAKQAVYAKRLDNLKKSIEPKATIKTDLPEVVGESLSVADSLNMEESLDEPITKFEARRDNKIIDDSEEEII